MRLKHLELQGFKTFAGKHEFVFPAGVTAIVGPNGSGKSNIADAIRWVLGEQSFSLLRAKRTEELIFSGSESRPRAGLASVALTLDNSDGWLPIEFSEITISRQATRDGQNKYYLNNSRVRLRDINELLGQSGLARRTYAFIGQGLVDQALSLRPEERRELFEEAAGIGVYQAKREETLRKLEEAQRNLERARDLLAEITPRLRSLKRQAERSEQHDRLSNELHDMLKTWYGYHWGRAQEALHTARSTASLQEAQLAKQQSELDELSDKLARVRSQQAALRSQLAAWQRQRTDVQARQEAIRRELAVFGERGRSLEAQLAELEAASSSLQAQRAEQAAQLDQAHARLEALRQQASGHAQRIALTQQALQERQAQRSRLNAQRAEAHERAVQLAAQVAERRDRQAQLAERQADLHHEQAAQQREQDQLEDELAKQHHIVQNVEAELAALAAQESQHQAGLADCAAQISASQQRQAALDDELVQAQAAETGLRAQLDTLDKVRVGLGGYSAGAQAIASAHIPGIRGALATLITVPPEWERAVEAALGPAVQALLADNWQAVLAARQLLADTPGAGGQATLIPLDLLEESAAQASFWQRLLARLAAWLNKPAAARRASQVVTCEPAVRPAVEALLGRTLLADDLAAARAMAARLRPGEQLVTPRGDVLRADGTAWLGQAGAGSGFLAREREWRELPAHLAAAQAHVRDVEARRDREAAHQLTCINQQAALTHAVEQVRQQQRGRSSERDALLRAAERLEQNIHWQASRVAQLQKELDALQAQQNSLGDEGRTLSAQRLAAEDSLAACDAQLAALPLEELAAQLSALQTDAAVAEQAAQGQQAVLASQQGALAQLDAQLAARAGRIAQLKHERFELQAQLESLHVKDNQLGGELAELDARIQPGETRLEQLERSQAVTETDESAARARIRDYELRYNAAQLDVSRRQDEINTLRTRVDEDLGLVELELTEDITAPLLLPLRPIIEELPTVSQLPEDLEQSIQRRKAALRRLGPINAEARNEYQQTQERHTFLTTQCADLEQAIASLHQVIAELDELMRQAFIETFKAIADEFKQTFAQLFGGGSAKIVLTDPDNLMATGIDIVARPPGKRQQGLALLSGGERSLTAAALLFAILKVRPTPFCVLDEVDAALDESNVVRFREMLQALGGHTQFIIITHNRGTVEIAGTIYGVTMGADHASRVLSYRLEGQDVSQGKPVEFAGSPA